MLAAAPVANATAVVAPDPTNPQRFIVLWAGILHGGCHFDLADAEAHAERLNLAADPDYADWLEDHGYGAV